MIELVIYANKILCGNIVLAIKNSMDAFLWWFFIVLFIIGGIIIGAMLLIFSRKPDDWEHKPIIDEPSFGGRLNYFVNTLKEAPSYSDDSPLKSHIQILFFEKVKAVHGITTEDLFNMKINEPKKLRNIIRNNEIADWILDVKPKDEKKDFFKTNKEEKKQKYISKINSILDKMEVWGE